MWVDQNQLQVNWDNRAGFYCIPSAVFLMCTEDFVSLSPTQIESSIASAKKELLYTLNNSLVDSLMDSDMEDPEPEGPEPEPVPRICDL